MVNLRSKEQEIEMLKKLSEILKILSTTKSIKEISKLTNIPTSTIQRYLNNKDLILKLLNSLEGTATYDQVAEQISVWLQQAKNEGHKKGGIISQEKYGYKKGEAGKFSGNRKNKIEKR